MIAMLSGRLAARTGTHVVVDCAGVGYRIAVPPGAVLPPVGEEAVIHTHTHVREDVLALYGFPTARERDVFELLVACQGVGPKVALACLSVLTPDQLSTAVLTNDLDTLVRVPGIGKRSAEKLVFELGPRLGGDGAVPSAAAGGHAEVREALAALGYGEKEAGAVVAKLPESGDTAELLRSALRLLGGGE